MTLTDLSPSPPTIPGYQIQKQMGQGGMATVYLAVQESFGRPVALKVMSDQLGTDDVWAQRFMHEARVVAQLSHSNIVPVFDVGSHGGRFYISMELLKGGKLDEKIQQGLPAAEAIRIACGVAAGLDYAGSKGFVHRDIKPDNIMFRDDGTPVILDFGIAKQKDGDSKMTKTGTIVGTTGYMSPEQAMGQELDERSDIYSLGIMLYELLTGRVPFHADSAVAVLLKHVQETPPPLPAALSVFQPALDKALAKKPEDRYQRANEMMLHLQELLTQYKQPTATSLDKTAVLNRISNTDATTVSTAVPAPVTASTKNPVVLFAGAAVIVAVLLAAFFWQKTPTESPSAATSAPAATTAAALVAEKKSSDNLDALTRILQGARDCMAKQQYDCARSKAESVLDIDPDNSAAKEIHAAAEKAQKAAFAGDWDAK